MINELCCATGSLCGCCSSLISPKNFPRIGYIILTIVSIGFSAVMSLFDGFVGFKNKKEEMARENLSTLQVSFYMMSFALFVTYTILLCLSFAETSIRTAAHQGYWPVKFLVVFGVYFLGIILPSSFYRFYGYFAWFASIAFLVYQGLVTISFGHILNIRLFQKSENSAGYQWLYKGLLIFLSILFAVIAIGLTCEDIQQLINNKTIEAATKVSCIIVLSLTAALGLILTILSVTIVENKRLLTSLYLYSYFIYLVTFGIRERQEKFDKSPEIWDIVLSLFYLLLAVGFVGFSIRKVGDDEKIHQSPILETDGTGNKYEQFGDSTDGGSVYQVSRATAYFIAFMLFFSFYFCIFANNWYVFGKRFILNGTWVRYSCSFLTIFMYFWVLMGPLCFPDRDFMF